MLQLKDLTGSTAVYYSVANPWEILLSFSINRLTLGDIVGLFLKKMSLPKEIADCGFPEGVEAYFCTGNVNFAGKVYPPGLYFKGTFALPFLGIRAETEVQVGQLVFDCCWLWSYMIPCFGWQTYLDCFMHDCICIKSIGDS